MIKVRNSSARMIVRLESTYLTSASICRADSLSSSAASALSTYIRGLNAITCSTRHKGMRTGPAGEVTWAGHTSGVTQSDIEN